MVAKRRWYKKHLRRIANHTIVIADMNGEPVVGPISLETLTIIWKYGGYSSVGANISNGIELGNGGRLYLYPPG